MLHIFVSLESCWSEKPLPSLWLPGSLRMNPLSWTNRGSQAKKWRKISLHSGKSLDWLATPAQCNSGTPASWRGAPSLGHPHLLLWPSLTQPLVVTWWNNISPMFVSLNILSSLLGIPFPFSCPSKVLLSPGDVFQGSFPGDPLLRLSLDACREHMITVLCAYLRTRTVPAEAWPRMMPCMALTPVPGPQRTWATLAYLMSEAKNMTLTESSQKTFFQIYIQWQMNTFTVNIIINLIVIILNTESSIYQK